MQNVKTILFALTASLLLPFSSLPASANDAARTLKSDKVQNIQQIIEEAQDAAGASDLTVDLVVWARGIQAYELESGGWAAKGPLADLFALRIRGNGTVKLKSDRIGTHYQHLATPAWEFDNGRVIAQGAQAIPGASDADVAWLNVDLQPNDFGYLKILRVETRAGLAPNNTNWLQGVRVGTGYETIYVFLR